MGRDDNKAIPGLQGGRAPAQAFHDFMVRAVASRPIEQFETQVATPEWATEPDEEVWFDAPPPVGQQVDGDGNPIGTPPETGTPAPPPEDQAPDGEESLEDLVERATNPDREREPVQRRPAERAPPPRDPRSDPDAMERRPPPPQP
jgi:penicillin-binding protein 1A